MSRVKRWSRHVGVRLVVLLTMALSALMVSPIPAHAAEVRKTSAGGTECTNELVKSGSSSTARLSAVGSAYVDIERSGRWASIAGIRSQLSNLSCRSDNGVATTLLKVRYVVWVDTVNLGSCSIGVPSGVTCAVEGRTIELTDYRTCHDVSVCRRDSAGQWYIDPPTSAGAVLQVRFKVYYYGYQAGKERMPTQGTQTQNWLPPE